MDSAKGVLTVVVSLVLLAGLAVAVYLGSWWLRRDTTDRNVGIRNRNTGVALVGKRREPVSPGVAVILVVIYALLIWGLLSVGTVQS